MKHHLWVWLLAFFAVTVSGLGVDGGPVLVVPVRTEISKAQFLFLRRALKDAEQQGASAIILDMDTYGGEVTAAIDSMNALIKTKVPTLTFINNKAISAGAIIALGTEKIYMTPTAVIGAAAPVQATGEDLSKTMDDKAASMLSAMARAAAQKNGHNPQLADAFISKAKEVKIGDVVIDGPDTLLTLSAAEAAKTYDGKPLLAAGIAANIDEVAKLAGLKGEVRRLEPSGFEQLAFWITTLSPIFLLGGVLGGYLEIKTPGFGLPGLVSLICFGLFFAGHFIAGLAGWEVAAFFAIGVALVLSELLLHPGTILPGVAGVVLMLGSVIWAMIDRYPSEPFWPSDQMFLRPLINVAITVVAAGALMAMLGRFLPKTSLYRRVALVSSLPSGIAPRPLDPILSVQVGMVGVAKTDLRPSGRALFTEMVDVVSAGDFISIGSPVQITQIEGTRVVVMAAE